MKINTIYAIYFIAIIMAAACTTDTIYYQMSDNQQKLSFCGSVDINTRISIGEKKGEVWPLQWEAGDLLSIWTKNPNKQNQTLLGEIAELYAGDAGKTTGVFQARNPFHVDEEQDILIVYPGNDVSYTAGKIKKKVSTIQNQKEENSNIHIGQNSFAIGEAKLLAGQTEDVNFILSQKTAFVKLILTTTEFSNLNLIGAKLYAPGEALSGEVEYNVNEDILSITTGKDEVGVILDNPILFDKEQTLYFTALPCDLSNKEVYVIISMSDESKTITIPAKINGSILEAGKLSIINIIDIGESTNKFKWYEPVETRYIAAYGQGWSYGPANCFISCFDGEAITFDVKARGNFTECNEPAALIVHNACDKDIESMDNIIINGQNISDGTKYLKIDLKDNYNVTIKANKIDGHTGYSSMIKLLDKNDKCIWAFNIWGVQEQPLEQKYKNGIMLDRNIGSDNIDSGDYINGSYYQWGRPFHTGGPELNSIYIARLSTVTDLSVSATNPEVFWYTKGQPITSKGDWYLGANTGSRSDRIDDLWGNPNIDGIAIAQNEGEKSIYDPCPKGYMVPSPKILNEIVGNTKVRYPDLVNKGKLYYKPGTTIFISENVFNEPNFLEYVLPDGSKAAWPFNGARWGASGLFADNEIQDICSCWGNAPVSNYSQTNHSAYLMTYRFKTGTWQEQNGSRSHGHPIRCMKDDKNR